MWYLGLIYVSSINNTTVDTVKFFRLIQSTVDSYKQKKHYKNSAFQLIWVHKDVLRLFPLNGRRRFAADIINYAVDAFDFIDDAVGYFAQQRIRQLCPVCGHKVAGDYGA